MLQLTANQMHFFKRLLDEKESERESKSSYLISIQMPGILSLLGYLTRQKKERILVITKERQANSMYYTHPFVLRLFKRLCETETWEGSCETYFYISTKAFLKGYTRLAKNARDERVVEGRVEKASAMKTQTNPTLYALLNSSALQTWSCFHFAKSQPFQHISRAKRARVQLAEMSQFSRFQNSEGLWKTGDLDFPNLVGLEHLIEHFLFVSSFAQVCCWVKSCV